MKYAQRYCHIIVNSAYCSQWRSYGRSCTRPKTDWKPDPENEKETGIQSTQLGEKAGLRQETVSLIETGNPSTTMETILNVLAALDLEFQIVPRSKGRAADIEEIF